MLAIELFDDDVANDQKRRCEAEENHEAEDSHQDGKGAYFSRDCPDLASDDSSRLSVDLRSFRDARGEPVGEGGDFDFVLELVHCLPGKNDHLDKIRRKDDQGDGLTAHEDKQSLAAVKGQSNQTGCDQENQIAPTEE